MIINSVNKGVIDTEKLSDANAELGEKIEEFKKFLLERNGELFIWAKVPGKTAWASIDIKTAEGVLSTVEALDMGIRKATENNNQVGLIVLPTSVIDQLKNGGGETDGEEWKRE